MTPEFSRPYRLDTIGSQPRQVSIEANEEERGALAQRFGLVSIARLEAEATLIRSGDTITATGRIRADVVQSCVATDLPVAAKVDEPFRIVFVPQPTTVGEEEVELGETDLDAVFYEGASIDLGEAIAETLSLSLDPYPRSPDADSVLREAGVKSEAEAQQESGPFAALKGLTKP